jgi:hypothetical protein
MTHHTHTLTPDRPAPVSANTSHMPTPTTLDGHGETLRIRRAGLTAGVALLVLAALSALSVLVAVDGLVTPGDAAKTAADITASETRFRLGVASVYLVALLDVVAAWALFRFFAPVHDWLSRLTAWLRVAYSVVFLVAISQLAAVPGLLNDLGHQDAFGERQLQAQAMLRLEAFDHTWMAALLLFGAHLALLGYLACRSGYVPRLVGVVLVIAGAGYAFDTFSSVLSADPVVISTYTSLGEFVLAVWLVVRGRRVHVGAGHEA